MFMSAPASFRVIGQRVEDRDIRSAEAVRELVPSVVARTLDVCAAALIVQPHGRRLIAQALESTDAYAPTWPVALRANLDDGGVWHEDDRVHCDRDVLTRVARADVAAALRLTLAERLEVERHSPLTSVPRDLDLDMLDAGLDGRQ
jgi:hypothetical protein